jgi:phage-related holin
MKITLTLSAIFAFLGSYFLNISAENFEQYMAICLVVFVDGFFGMWAGVRSEGFKTHKALKVLRNVVFWEILLTIILVIEKGFTGTFWLSETVITPFLIFQLISILKNASLVGIIKNELLVNILDKIDRHKDYRKQE